MGIIDQAMEQERLDALYRYELLDSAPDSGLYQIVARAAELLETPSAGFSVVDRDRIRIRESVGIAIREIDRPGAFCDRTVTLNRPQVVQDALESRYFGSNALVRGEPYVRFYAGVPVRAQSGHALGALFVIGKEPRAASKAETELLESLAREMELRLALRRMRSEIYELAEDRAVLADMLIHDVGSSCADLKGWIQAVCRGELSSDELDERYRKMATGLQEISSTVMRISQPGTHGIPVHRRRVEIRGWFDLLAGRISRSVRSARLEFHCLNLLPARMVRFDTVLLERVVGHLVRSSIDACNETCRVLLEARYRDGGRLELHLADDGPGIPAAVRDHIFEPGVAWPPGSHRRAGPGLAASRLAAEALGGTIVLVPHSDSATEFVVDVPVSEH